LGIQGERATKALDGAGARGACRGWLPGSYEVHLIGTSPGRGSRGCWTAIDCHIHGVLNWWDCGGRSGGANGVWLSRTFFECGSVIITAVAAMGGRGQTTGWDWLIVPAPGAGGILPAMRRASMVKRTNRARQVGGGHRSWACPYLQQFLHWEVRLAEKASSTLHFCERMKTPDVRADTC